ncbi:MAG TPA: hypothetical protein VEA18_01255 [Candidatus Kapabacteria bacterium]|nr:hypothetical protein [Candidatus Kapabacteria bacterium]
MKKLVFLLFMILAAVGVVMAVIWFEKRSNGNENLSNTAKNTVQGEDLHPDDTDRDGLSNAKEKELGLSATTFDTDGDSLDDASEIDVWKTDPKKADTDGDGVRDGVEVMDKTNPRGR